MNWKGSTKRRSWNKLNYFTGMFLGRLEENNEKYHSG
jgi:hypothetical protein